MCGYEMTVQRRSKNYGNPFPALKKKLKLQSQWFFCGIGLVLHLFISQLWLFIWQLLVINSNHVIQTLFFLLDSAFIYNNSEFISHNSGFFSQNWLQMFWKSIGHCFQQENKKNIFASFSLTIQTFILKFWVYISQSVFFHYRIQTFW